MARHRTDRLQPVILCSCCYVVADVSFLWRKSLSRRSDDTPTDHATSTDRYASFVTHPSWTGSVSRLRRSSLIFLAVCSRLRLSEQSAVLSSSRLAWRRTRGRRCPRHAPGDRRSAYNDIQTHALSSYCGAAYLSRIIQNGIVYVFMYDDTIVTTIPIV